MSTEAATFLAVLTVGVFVALITAAATAYVQPWLVTRFESDPE
jgi:hypothetical protein